MKTEKTIDEKINDIKVEIEHLKEERANAYKEVQDFTVSSNRTGIVMKHLASITSTIKTKEKQIKRLLNEQKREAKRRNK